MTPNLTPTNIENPVSGVGSLHAEKLSNLRAKLGDTVEAIEFPQTPTEVTGDQTLESHTVGFEPSHPIPTFEPKPLESIEKLGSYFDNTPPSFAGEESSFEPPVFSTKLPEPTQDIAPKSAFSAQAIEVQPPVSFPHTEIPKVEQAQPKIEIPGQISKPIPQELPVKIQEIKPLIPQNVPNQPLPAIQPVITEKSHTLASIVTFLTLDKKSQVISGAPNFEQEALKLK
jgi:hypothetical protein